MNRNVLKLAIPSILANITVPLVGMVDLAIAGRLGDASLIGGIAVATMLFDLLYWNMSFLRTGTGGMVAQAYGRRDFNDAMRVFTQGMATAFLIALLIWAVQYLFVEAAFMFIDASPQVEQLAREYYFIRIWAAPATLSLYVFKGFFIGMQNAVSPMAVDLTVNIVNLAASVYFAMFAGMGFSGIAMGTVVAQYSGMILASVLLVIYYKKLFKYIDIRKSVKFKYIRSFFVINADLFIRSVCFLFIYAGFTSLSARFGDVLLAVSTIMMKLMLLYSYFIDGFAYAGEALAGRYIGAKDPVSLKKAVRVIFAWCMGIGFVSTIVYVFAGEPLFRLMTDNARIIESSGRFMPWLLIMPVISCIAFTWDGIFLGATASKTIRNGMIWSVVGFFAAYYITVPHISVQALWVAFMTHLLIRTVYMSATAKKQVFARART